MDTVIYRRGNESPVNLTPRPQDTDGLSYQLTNPPFEPYTKTTMGKVKGTGVLTAVKNAPNHVSVRPTDPAAIKGWQDSRPTANENPHPLTKALRAISIKQPGGTDEN